MKRILITLVTIVCFFFYTQTTSAQAATYEVGVRIGDNTGIDGTIPLGISPRLHPTIYLENFGVGTYFDWMFALTDGPSGLKFYPGVGPEFFFENDFDFNVAGNFGVEYAFNFPITIGFDWRPGFAVTNNFDFISSNWGFMIRYRFKEGGFKKVN
ncbi:hypothetical protein [Eudoraea sp.]|uniref:hypothetical protein n=1 Tax=Eudoraea sp. TaxID=1979955 RepID=UPI003C72DFBE